MLKHLPPHSPPTPVKLEARKLACNAKTPLDRLLISVLICGSYKLYHKVLPISLFEGLSHYSPSYLEYFKHLAKGTGVAIVMFIGDQL